MQKIHSEREKESMGMRVYTRSMRAENVSVGKTETATEMETHLHTVRQTEKE